MTSPSTLATVRPSFRAVVRAVAPLSTDFDEDAWRSGEAAVDETLSDRPPGVRRQVVLFMRVLGLLARLRYGRSFAALSPERARALLGALERSPVLLLRRGVWGVRTLAFMAVYTQPAVQEALGYRAGSAGWEARGGGQGPWRSRGGAGAPESWIVTAAEDGPGA